MGFGAGVGEIPDAHRWDTPPKIRFAPDSPLEEAVLSELVSEAKFPGNWEKYRDFYRRDL